MKKMLMLMMSVMLAFGMTSCTSVDSGHKGVEVSWGGKTNMETIYPEGMTVGLHWTVDNIVQYDVREKTYTEKFEFNDKNNMPVPVTISIDCALQADKVNYIHSKIGADQIDNKRLTTTASAAKEVIPQYSGVELNLNKRAEAEDKIFAILQKEFPGFYMNVSRVRLTDVDLPGPIAELAVQTATQIGKNELASKKEAEQVALAKARVAEAEGEYQASVLQAKTRDILSSPKMLELQRVENERIMWEGYNKHGHSPFGDHNMYGVVPAVIRQIAD